MTCLIHTHTLPYCIQHTKADPFDVVEYFQALPKKQHPVVWAALLALTENAVERLDDKVEEGVCSVLSGVILFCEGALAQESLTLPASFAQTLQLLHGGLRRVARCHGYN